jgi:hypothetical protein
MPGISSFLNIMELGAHLEHLDERDTETEVGVVGQNQRSREKGSDR